MYDNSTLGASVIPPVVATGTVAVLPATGVDFITTLAIAVAAGLVAWGSVYFYKTVRK